MLTIDINHESNPVAKETEDSCPKIRPDNPNLLDPFNSEINASRLMHAAKRMNRSGGTVHDLVPEDN